MNTFQLPFIILICEGFVLILPTKYAGLNTVANHDGQFTIEVVFLGIVIPMFGSVVQSLKDDDLEHLSHSVFVESC